MRALGTFLRLHQYCVTKTRICSAQHTDQRSPRRETVGGTARTHQELNEGNRNDPVDLVVHDDKDLQGVRQPSAYHMQQGSAERGIRMLVPT